MSIKAILVTLLFASSVAHAAENSCRPEINPISTNELAYQQRGDRCEGLFVQKVSATGLRIAAFHMHPANYGDMSLAVNISLGDSPSLKFLTVTSLMPRQFYRMDTVSIGNNYSLPLDLVRHPEVDVAPSDFAVVVCEANCDTFLPTLTPASFSSNALPNPYIVLIANLEIFELHVSITDSNTAEILFDKEMLGNRTWPAARAATFPLKPYFEGRESIIFEVTAVGRGNELIDSVSARLVSQ